MKVMMITPYSYPKMGGLEKYAYKILSGLVKAHNVDGVVCTVNHNRKKLEVEEIDKIKVYRLPHDIKISNTPIPFNLKRELSKIISKEEPDIINGHIPVPYLGDVACRVSKKRGIPFALTYHNDLTKENLILDLLCKGYYLLMGNKSLKLTDVIIATSTYYRDKSPYLARYMSKVKIIPPGVDVKRFTPEIDERKLREMYDIPDNIVLFVGQLDKTHRHKGLQYLLKAMSKINEETSATLVIVGSGNDTNRYKNFAKKLNLKHKVIFAGYVKENMLPFYYRGADVTVLPPFIDSEGFGMTLIEANACGKPVIGTNVGGIPHVIKDGYNGILVTPKDVNALTKAIIHILKNPDLTKKLGKNGRDLVTARYSWEMSTKKTLEIFKKTIEGGCM